MLHILSRNYLGISRQDIVDNIKYHWPFLARKPDSQRYRSTIPASFSKFTRERSLLKEAHYYFIGPIVKNYVEHGYNTKTEISSKLRSSENPRGISTIMIQRIARQEYGASSWADFLARHGAKLSPQSLSLIDIREFIKVGGKSQEDYIKFVLSNYVIRGLDENEMVLELQSANLHFTHKTTLQRYIYKWWGSLANARKQLVAPILALCFKLGYSSAQIRANVPFFQRRMSGVSAGDAVYGYCKSWFRISPTEARNILANSLLNDFLNQYLYNQ